MESHQNVDVPMPWAARLKAGVLQHIFQLIFGADNLALLTHLDWQTASQTLTHPQVAYPDYYTQPNTHGIDGSYLNPLAAVTYDRITAIASPPHEGWVRQQLINAICQASPTHEISQINPTSSPETILDLGCGTGSTTVALKHAFPQATVTGLDLSPLMLVMARRKAQAADLHIQWCHGLAEAPPLAPATFDLVTASFLCHEVPPAIAQGILRSCFQLLKPGGHVFILDGDQSKLRRLPWLIRLFQEPYSLAYAQGCVDQWLTAAGFTAVTTKRFGWIHQLSQGTKSDSA